MCVKKTILILTALLIFIPITNLSANTFAQENLEESRALSKGLFSKLKHALVTGMKEGGPTAAIAACSQKAQAITDRASNARKGIKVRRTSLRLRNQKNAPDAWEIKGLEQFEARVAAGESMKDMEYFSVVGSNGNKQFRYIMRIPVIPITISLLKETFHLSPVNINYF